MTDRFDNIPETALAWHRAGKGAALATVVQTWGSAPRRVGSQLAITAEGEIQGSVSGGCVEGAVIVEAVEAIADGQDIIKLGDAEVNARAYCSAFNFKGGTQQKKVSLLSGGERNRVHMARLLRSGGNVLLLDEPTNDLDVETLRALEDALVDFAGCAVVISHDRFFLDRICTHILAFEGDAHVEWFEGNFEDYEEDKKRRLGPDALEPTRIKHKKFTR